MVLAAAGVYGGGSDYDKLAVVLAGTTLTSAFAINDTGWHCVRVAFDPARHRNQGILSSRSDAANTTVTFCSNSHFGYGGTS